MVDTFQLDPAPAAGGFKLDPPKMMTPIPIDPLARVIRRITGDVAAGSPEDDKYHYGVLPLQETKEGDIEVALPEMIRSGIRTGVEGGQKMRGEREVDPKDPATAQLPAVMLFGGVGRTPVPGMRSPMAGEETPKAGAAPKPEPTPPPFKLDEMPPTPAKVEAPGPMLDPPPETEGVKQTATRIDDGLYRIRKNDTADKVEAKQFLESLSPAELDPKLQERVYTEIEQRMINPGAKLSPESQKFYDEHLKPWKEEEQALGTELRSRLGKDAEGTEIPEPQAGYVHRKVASSPDNPRGRGEAFGALDPEGYRNADPVMGGGRTLSKFASSLQGRKFFVLEDEAGNRTFLTKPPPKDMKVGGSHKATDDHSYTLKPATTAEIEGNTAYRYHKNAVVNTVDNVLRLRRVKRNLDMLDEIKPQLLGRDLMVQRGGNREVPPGFVKTTLPQFEGFVMDPRIASVLNDFHGELMRGGALDQVMAKINRFITGTIFFTPIPHAANVMNHWIVGRGWDWMPQNTARLMKTATRAIKAVVTQNEDYVRMLREGSGLMYGDVANQNFYKLMIEKMGREQVADPQTWIGIARDLGFKSIADMVKWEYRASSKALWAISDMFMLQRQFELMEKGIPVREAIRQAERDIPNYRVPSEVMGSRAVSELLQNQRLLMFGKYKYGQFRAYATMVRDLVKGTGEERLEAAGKLMVMGLMGLSAYKLADMAVQAATGDKNAGVYRHGPFGIPQALYELTQGQRDWLSTMSSIVTPAPVVEIGSELLTNKDAFGRPIIQPDSSPLGKGVQAGEYAAGKIGPLGTAEQIMRNPTGGIARQFGVKIPAPGQDVARARAAKRDLSQAKSREKRDVIEQTIRRAAE